MKAEFTTLEQFGGCGDGTTDNLSAWNCAVAYCGDNNLPLVLVDGTYRISTTARVDQPIRITALSKGVKLLIENSNTEEGLFILSSDVMVEGFTLSVFTCTAIINGTGDKGTNITMSEWFVNPCLPEPNLVKNIIVRDMILMRESGSKTGHAISIVSRTSNVLIENVDFIGAGDNPNDGMHGDAVLTHWGAWSHGVSTTGLKFVPKTANFTEGATLTGATSGAKAYIVKIKRNGPSGTLYLKNVVGKFRDNETITDEFCESATAKGASFTSLVQDQDPSFEFLEVSTIGLDFDSEKMKQLSERATLTGATSGATAYIVKIKRNVSSGTLYLTNVVGKFRDNETITDEFCGSATANGDSYSSLVQSRFEPNHYSFHPNNVRIRNIRCRNVGRVIACSASYAIDVDGVDYLGPNQGGQLVDLPVGDESSTFAHPDDYGRVYDGFSFRNFRARNITGTGANAVTVLDCSGFSTSKQTDEDLQGYRHYNGEKYAGKAQPRRRQPFWKNVIFENFTWDAGPACPPSATSYERQIYLRNLAAQMAFRNIYAEGRGTNEKGRAVLGLVVSNVIGRYTFDTCYFKGGMSLKKVNGATFTNCKVYHPEIGETPQDTFALEISGGTSTAKTSGKHSAGSTTVNLLAPGLTERICKGKRVTYSGGTFQLTEFGEEGDKILQVTALPTTISSDTTLTFDQITRQTTFNDCFLSGGDEGIDIENAVVSFYGGQIRDTGQYGVLVKAGAELLMEGTHFGNNGLRHLEASTRDLIVEYGKLIAKKLRFQESTNVDYNIVVKKNADKVSIRDCVFAGHPIRGFVSFANLADGKLIIFEGNVKDDGFSINL